MGKNKYEIFMDTVSSTDTSERIIQNQEISKTKFDYKTLCKYNLCIPKRKMDACFLVPLRLFHRKKEVQSAMMFQKIETWIDIFIRKGNHVGDFWIYLDYLNGFDDLKNLDSDEKVEKCIDTHICRSVNAVMGDVSRTENAAYVKELCKKRDADEYWILRAYELTLKHLFEISELWDFMRKIILYLKSCDIKVDIPMGISGKEDDRNYLYQVAANLILLMFRLRFDVTDKVAVKWYRDGNESFFCNSAWMLQEYMRIVGECSYQSYERLIKMQGAADENHNKYAAKEVGDIYRLGAELWDSQGTLMHIAPDQEKACDYYKISITEEYVPAYISAIKTEALIDAGQIGELLDKSREEQDPEGCAYYISMRLKEADSYVNTDFNKGVECLKDVVAELLLLEDMYEEKYLLKNEILLSEVYRYFEGQSASIPEELQKNLKMLYGRDILVMDETVYLTELETNYIRAGELGYFGAEYALGSIFKDYDTEKSEQYFAKGNERGCSWCKLEHARTLRTSSPEQWMKQLLEVKDSQTSKKIQLAIAEELADYDEAFLEQCESFAMSEVEWMEFYILADRALDILYENVIKASTRKAKKEIQNRTNKILILQETVQNVIKKMDNCELE